MATPGKLTVDTATGHVTGPASIAYNDPFPTQNGSWGSGAMMGVVMHTMVGDLPGTVSWFNNPQAQASAHFGIDQSGNIHQFGPIGKGWIAWAQASGNEAWYSIEHADNGNPGQPADLRAGCRLGAAPGVPVRLRGLPAPGQQLGNREGLRLARHGRYGMGESPRLPRRRPRWRSGRKSWRSRSRSASRLPRHPALASR